MRTVRRSILNFVVDAVSLVALLGLIATGLIVRYILPAGSGGRGRGAAASLWGLGRHDWGDVHFWLAVGIIALLIVHVALHWTWTCALVRRWVAPGDPSVTRRVSWRRHVYGVGLLASIALSLAAFTRFAQANVETSRGTCPHVGRVERLNHAGCYGFESRANRRRMDNSVGSARRASRSGLTRLSGLSRQTTPTSLTP